MTPVGGASSIGAAVKKGWVELPSYNHLGSFTDLIPGGASVSHFEKFVGPGGGAVSGSYEFSGASSSLFDKFVGPAGGAASFVLSSRPIPGRNCLVIQSNFADLMDALKSTGGATVRFA
jgi:hypothetical protein